VTFDDFCRRLEHLRLDRSGGLVKPYKPVLVAAVVLLVHKGKLPSRNVFLDGGLRSAFHQLLRALYPRWPTKDPKPEYPFRHLENDGVWRLVPIEGAEASLRDARETGGEAWDVLRHVKCAQLDEEVFAALAGRFEARVQVLRLLAVRYFPPETSGRLWHYLGETDDEAAPPGSAAEGGRLSERALEEHLETHWDETPFAGMGVELSRREAHGLPGRQVFTPVNAIDLLGFQPAKRCWWVFELKRGRAVDRVVGQVSRYLGWIAEERRGRRETAVGAIIARKSDQKLRFAVKANERLSLWEYDEGLRLRQVGG
jgi:hypothetical protein